MKRGVDKIQSSLHQIDAVIEVHDARIPFSGRNSQLKDVIHIRPHILLLNKCDMTDMSRKDEIVKKLKDEGFSNVYFSNFTSKHILKKVRNDIIPMLMKEIENRPRFRTDVMNRYNIMVLGIPNVGKSTLLNKLLEAYTTKRSVATVGALPGVTRSVMNKVKVNFDPETYVVDTPGILNPKITNVDVGMRLALCDCIPNHLIGKDVIVDYLLYWLNKHEMFSYVKHYSLSEPTDNVNKLLSEVALRNKFVVPVKDKSLEQKYRLNFEKACSHVIKDFQHGKFGKIMLDDDLLD
ncbi:Mitochondrial GTPase [Mactra antiquata]